MRNLDDYITLEDIQTLPISTREDCMFLARIAIREIEKISKIFDDCFAGLEKYD